MRNEVIKECFTSTYERLANGNDLGTYESYDAPGEVARSEVSANRRNYGVAFAFNTAYGARGIVVAGKNGYVVRMDVNNFFLSSKYARTPVSYKNDFTQLMAEAMTAGVQAKGFLEFLDGDKEMDAFPAFAEKVKVWIADATERFEANYRKPALTLHESTGDGSVIGDYKS